MPDIKILALGDCNTLGLNDCEYNSFPEQVATALQGQAINLGHTMATTREGVQLFDEHIKADTTLVMLSFGLTDSWRGFKYAPYVLYYPDTPLRKIGRKLVKKMKKVARNTGLNQRLGTEHVTPPALYLANMQHMIERSPTDARILLLDTLPKREEDRNLDIVQFNALLDPLAERYPNVLRVRFYDYFHHRREQLFQDKTHLNQAGCKQLANFILDALSE